MFNNQNSLENLIYKQIQKGPIYSPDLIVELKKIRPGTTKQGVYAVLRKLKKQEVILTQKKHISFNIRWLNDQKRFLSIAEKYYLSAEGKESFLTLKEGDKITYSFADPVQTDTFWWQALYALSESSKSNEPAYLYNPHEWFLIARKESELESMKLISQKRQWLLTVPAHTALDKATSKYFDGEITQLHLSEKQLSDKNNYYFNIVDDFIIEVWIDKDIANMLEKFYEHTTALTELAEAELEQIITKKGRTKLMISRNYRKTEKLKQSLNKHFYIKKSLRA